MSDGEMHGFRRLLLLEKELSLKLVFDNFRNCAIIGGLAAMAQWFSSGKATPPPILFTGPRGGMGNQSLDFPCSRHRTLHFECLAKRLYCLTFTWVRP